MNYYELFKSDPKAYFSSMLSILEPTNSKDPLPYYFKPLIGRLYRARIKQALSLLNLNSASYKSILEVGYGSGILLPILYSIGNSVYGIDLEADALKVKLNLEKIGVHVKLTNGDIRNVDYPNESFDLVIAISVIEHIQEPQLIVKKVFNLLRHGGEFLVGMPRVDSVMSKMFHLIGCRNIEDFHVTNYHQFLKIATDYFKLVKFSKLPKCVPQSLALYFNMLLHKE